MEPEFLPLIFCQGNILNMEDFHTKFYYLGIFWLLNYFYYRFFDLEKPML
jgi:hypothetical protein